MGNKSHYDPSHKRVFVREISGEYSLKHELKRLRELPRVQKGGSVTFQSGPQTFSKHFMEPEDGLAQTLHIHLEEYAPGAKSQMHGHVNEAIFYILDGRGYEIHDGIKYDWKAGDICIVEPGCVHQHFNADPEHPARIAVITNRIYRKSGLNDLEQLETAPEYDPNEKLTAEKLKRYLQAKASR